MAVAAAAAIAVIAAPAGARSSGSGAASGSAAAFFRAGAAVESFSPPAAGALQSDPADCLTAADSAFNGPRQFAFEEPYIDQQHDGHYDVGDPFLDCNHDGRWDGNTLGGGAGAPRYYTRASPPQSSASAAPDQVGARALVISNGRKTIAMEVVDNEGLFNVYADRIRAKVLADGYRLDNIQISSTHDESAPDTIGLGGQDSLLSGTNAYFANFLVQQSALAIEQAYNGMVPAHIRYAEAREPANLRQCWSSYPFIDNPLMPVLQAIATDGTTIATLASVGQHTETLGFNGGSQLDPGTPYTLDQENKWVSGDWPYWFRTALESTYGGVGIEMAGAVGSVETPEVFSAALSRTPQRFVDEGHPAGCRTLFTAPAGATMAPLGYFSETKQLGDALAGAVQSALSSGSSWSRSNEIWAQTQNICVPVDNALFKAAAVGGTFAERPAYLPGCRKLERVPVAPSGQTAGTSIESQAAAWRIGDAEFVGAPGEVFPFTFFRGPVGPEDMNYPQYAMPAWPLPYMHTPWRFFDGIDNDMIGYIFPRGNDAGVPGQHPVKNPTASGTDRFGCGHSDDSEAATDKSGNIIGTALVAILGRHAPAPEAVVQGRYVLPDGKLSRNPEGTTDTIKCTAPTDTTFAADGPAVAVWVPGRGVVAPAQWMDLLGRSQATPDRDTRGWIDSRGHRHWLDVFADIAGQPQAVTP
jgi:hypothetical protein